MNGGDVASDSRRWLLYALGGGSGHLMRSLALAKVAARHGITTRILTNSLVYPAIKTASVIRLLELDPSIDVVMFDSSLDATTVTALIHRELEGLGAEDLFVVDTFPRGITGELAGKLTTIPAFRVFIHRDLNLEYVRQFDVENAVAQYDLVLLPGEDAPLKHRSHAYTNPWLLCDESELLWTAESRRVFGIESDDTRPLVVVSGCGHRDESVAFADLARLLKQRLGDQAHVRFASLYSDGLTRAEELGISVWPLMAALPGVDLLVGAGGYHTVYEARATGTPLMAIPHHRLYDRQGHRLRTAEKLSFIEEAVSGVTERLGDRAKVRMTSSFPNGAEEAFQLISTSAYRDR